MNCRECVDHLYEFLDREVTPDLERDIRAHLVECPPCGEQFDFEAVYLKFLRARCRAQGAPEELKRRVLRELFGE
jgi:anti-sigma factor (TIGR02949 family)